MKAAHTRQQMNNNNKINNCRSVGASVVTIKANIKSFSLPLNILLCENRSHFEIIFLFTFFSERRARMCHCRVSGVKFVNKSRKTRCSRFTETKCLLRFGWRTSLWHFSYSRFEIPFRPQCLWHAVLKTRMKRNQCLF